MENNASTGRPYSTGYALSGGLTRGFAHSGVIQALLEHDIKPDIILGVSAGVLAGVFYADGNEPYRVLNYFSGHKLQDLTKLMIPKVDLSAPGEFIDSLKSNLKTQKLKDLELPLIITAIDLDYGRSIYLHKGNITERVAVPCYALVLLIPIKIENTHCVGEGLLMNLPVSTTRNECGKVVAVNVSPLMAERYKTNIVGIIMRSYHFVSRANTLPERGNCDLPIEPYNLEGYNNTELEKAEETFEQGYNITSGILNQLTEEKGKIWKQ